MLKNSQEQQATAWQAVFETLYEIDPAFHTKDESDTKSAIRFIKELAEKAKQADNAVKTLYGYDANGVVRWKLTVDGEVEVNGK